MAPPDPLVDQRYGLCFIRKQKILLTPEEDFRQTLLKKLVFELGFNQNLLSVEKKIGQRRYDIVCYTKEFTPLLIIECKSKRFEDEAIDQLLGYNHFVKAPFFALASPQKIEMFWQRGDKRESVPFIPKFDEIYAQYKRD